MMDLATIEHLNRKAAARSRREGILPLAISLTALLDAGSLQGFHERGIRLPFIGSRRPRGFKALGEALFVDTSGFGEEGEPALTLKETYEEMVKLTREHGTLAWATVSHGQFQAYLQPYRIRG